MDTNTEKSILTSQSGTNFYRKITLTDKSKKTLILRVIIISLCCIFFPLEAIIDSSLEEIEINSYIYNRNQLFIKSETYQQFVNILTIILGTNDSIMIYISIVYIIIHPFIGLKLILVSSISQYIITVMQIIYQAQRPFWDSDQVETICKNSYPNPSLTFFYCGFFYIYLFISFKMFNKKKFQTMKKIILFVVYFSFIAVLYFMFITSFFLYHHQIVYNIIMSLVVIVLLIDFDSKIYNFIFNFLKNLYNTRVYKMKIFYFVTGLYVFEYVGLFFIEDKEINKIKDNLIKNKYCTEFEIDTVGAKVGILNTSFVAGLVGAFWGSAFTVEKKVGKWWNRKSKKNVIIKIICTLIVCGVFTGFIYLLKGMKDKFELYFSLKTLLNFLESYFVFGLLPLFFQYLKINDAYENQSYEKINLKLTNEEDYQIFRKSIFIHEKKNKNDVFVVIDKVDKEKEKEKIKEDDEKKNLIETENKKQISINDESKEEESKESEENEEKENKENKDEDNTISMIINNLVEIKEEENDYEFNIDNDKENKQPENINNLKEDLINNDDEE